MQHEFKEDFIDSLVADGWKIIGNGYFSVALARDENDHVIKVGARDNWPDFIMWSIAAGFNGTFVPKCFSLEHHRHFYVAEMERCLDASKHKDAFNWKIINAFDRATSWTGDTSGLPVNWLPFFKAFKAEWSKTLDYQDLKPANWLVRPNGSLCLNDPVHGNRCKFHGSYSAAKASISETRLQDCLNAVKVQKRQGKFFQKLNLPLWLDRAR